MKRVRLIYEFYKIYDEDFLNKKYVYYSRQNTLPIEFTKNNFAHLTGFEYYDGNNKLKAGHVYNLLKNNKLAVRNLSEKNDGSSLQKMQVYRQFKSLKNKTNLVISNKEVMNLNLDGIIATNKKILAIGVRDNRPITLLNQKPKFNMGSYEKVERIEIYNLGTGNLIERVNLD